MNIKLLLTLLLWNGLLMFTACVDELKPDKKVVRVLLQGIPDESNYKRSEQYFKEGNYSEALKYDLKQLEEDLKYYKEKSAEISLDYNNIGLDYQKLKKFSKALEYYTKSMEIDKDVLDRNNTEKATTFYNMATTYSSLNEKDRALIYYLRAFAIDTNDKNNFITSQDIAKNYELNRHFKQSLIYYKKALLLQEKLYGKEDETRTLLQDNINGVKKKISLN